MPGVESVICQHETKRVAFLLIQSRGSKSKTVLDVLRCFKTFEATSWRSKECLECVICQHETKIVIFFIDMNKINQELSNEHVPIGPLTMKNSNFRINSIFLTF